MLALVMRVAHALFQSETGVANRLDMLEFKINNGCLKTINDRWFRQYVLEGHFTDRQLGCKEAPRMLGHHNSRDVDCEGLSVPQRKGEIGERGI